ncbi:MAG: NAD(P)-dependent oxidoreductase [Halobacteriaceae archaeon]
MRLAVFGASGRTGVPLVEQAVERGHEVVAFVRSAERPLAALRDHDRVRVVEGDAYGGAGVREAVDGADAVVSVLGHSDGGPDDLLTVAGRRVLDAMDGAGVDRLVTLVGAGVREEGEPVSLGGRVMGALSNLFAGAVLDDAEAHVEAVRESDTRWTVVRAPRLTEGEHTGRLRHGPDLRLGVRDTAARANVAQFVLDCLEGDRYVREMPKVADA